jgi:pimeloyl-ACP methyl ester carboxylesterase
MTFRFRVGVALLCAALLVAGCGSELKVAATELGGPDTLGLSAEGERVKGVVVYFHGADQSARVLQDSEKHAEFFDSMLRAGYAVVAADAGGNAYGNPQSRDDYRRLISAATQHYGTTDLFYVSESMGTLAALALLSADTQHQVKGLVGITPLMALPPEARAVSYIQGPWAGAVPDAADPVTWPPEAFAGRDFRLYRAAEDDTIPDDAGARAFADQFGEVAQIEVIDCPGEHVAPACYRGDEVANWMVERN